MSLYEQIEINLYSECSQMISTTLKTRAPVVIENVAVKYDSFCWPEMVQFLPYHWSVFTFTIYIGYTQILSDNVVYRDSFL